MINAVNATTLFLNTILAVTVISIPNLSWLFSTTQETAANKISNGYEITVNAGRVTSAKARVYRPSISYGYWTFLWGFILEYHLKNVHEFGSCFDQYFEQNEGGTIKNPPYNWIQYSSTFKITDSDLKLTEFENGKYEIQISEAFELGQYKVY
ncbi:MAG: hypothetical protein RE471_09040 [Ferroplasma sp.]|uniref:hypothetical protein n=1 Tax=Ferroplasma sp. TaxID=2591003 RepID=UPI0028154230|nr:hypothetical protein [Ferroplasma sp.]WMT51109.1 MAG: hypothetical protein RE471_09040 [Ferroplasma sp.]